MLHCTDPPFCTSSTLSTNSLWSKSIFACCSLLIWLFAINLYISTFSEIFPVLVGVRFPLPTPSTQFTSASTTHAQSVPEIETPKVCDALHGKLTKRVHADSSTGWPFPPSSTSVSFLSDHSFGTFVRRFWRNLGTDRLLLITTRRLSYPFPIQVGHLSQIGPSLACLSANFSYMRFAKGEYNPRLLCHIYMFLLIPLRDFARGSWNIDSALFHCWPISRNKNSTASNWLFWD